MSSSWMGIGTALVLLTFIVELLRRGVLREKFAFLWLVVSVGAMVVALWPSLLTAASQMLGFEVPANLLFIISLALVLLVSVQLSFEVSRLESHLSRLAEEHALLTNRVQELHHRIEGGDHE